MFIRNRILLVLVSFLCLGISSCSSAPKKIEMLEQARADYSEVSKDKMVAIHASEQLGLARDALNEADSRWKKNYDQWLVEHYAYIAKQRVETARLVSEGKEAEREAGAMAAERSLLNSRLRETELEKVRMEAAELKRKMTAVRAQQTERGMMLTLGDVLFDVDKATLTPIAARNIAKIALFMRRDETIQALIEGHTDNMGSTQHNDKLAQKRSLAVRDALVDAGVEASRISTQSFGESVPIASNDSAIGRQVNRRVEIIFPDTDIQISNFDDF